MGPPVIHYPASFFSPLWNISVTRHRIIDNVQYILRFSRLSVNGACPSLVICAVPTPVRATPELSGPAFGVLPKTGDEELEDRGKPG